MKGTDGKLPTGGITPKGPVARSRRNDTEVAAINPEIKAKAEALAEALAQSDEFKAFQSAREELEKHEAAKIMLRDLHRKQASLQQKVMQGQAPSEAEVQSLQETYQLVAFNPYVRRVIEAEFAFTNLLAEVQEILAKAVGMELPEEAGAGQGPRGPAAGGSGEAKKPDAGSSARSRLWVPGRP